MQSFWNKIYDNAHDIIGWDPNKGKKNVDMGMSVKEDEISVGTVGWRIADMKFIMVKGTYLPIPSRPYGEG